MDIYCTYKLLLLRNIICIIQKLLRNSLYKIVKIFIRIFSFNCPPRTPWRNVHCQTVEAPSHLGFIMRCLKTWQETGGQFREHETERLPPWVRTSHPHSSPRALTGPLLLRFLSFTMFVSLLDDFSSLLCFDLPLLLWPQIDPARPCPRWRTQSTGCFWRQNVFPLCVFCQTWQPDISTAANWSVDQHLRLPWMYSQHGVKSNPYHTVLPNQTDKLKMTFSFLWVTVAEVWFEICGSQSNSLLFNSGSLWALCFIFMSQ